MVVILDALECLLYAKSCRVPVSRILRGLPLRPSAVNPPGQGLPQPMVLKALPSRAQPSFWNFTVSLSPSPSSSRTPHAWPAPCLGPPWASSWHSPRTPVYYVQNQPPCYRLSVAFLALSPPLPHPSSQSERRFLSFFLCVFCLYLNSRTEFIVSRL